MEPQPKNYPQPFDALAAYADWFMQNNPRMPACPWNGITRTGAFSGIVLHRSGQFQTQLWLADPNCEIPDHKHPDVDVIHVHIAGNIEFLVNGKSTTLAPAGEPSFKTEDNNVMHPSYGAFARVKPGDTHGAIVTETGGAFITFQHWIKGQPESVERNWDGPSLGKDHKVS